MSVRLLSSDKEEFVVQKQSAEQSVFIENMICEGESDAVILLPNVTAKVLRKVIEWCDHHISDTEGTEDWDKAFFQVDQDLLFDIILAANYLDIKSLLDAGCTTVSTMIKGRSIEEMKTMFNVTNDFTPEEEAQIRRENDWEEDQ